MSDDVAHQRIMEALAGQPCDRPELLIAFGQAALRRIPADQLEAADRDVMARRLADAFATLDERGEREASISIRRPAASGDSGAAPVVVLDIATEDRPFLWATMVDELERRGHRVVRSFHPVVGVERDADRRVSAIVPARTASNRESLVHLEVEGALAEFDDEALADDLRRLLRDVRTATDDYPAMRSRLETLATELRECARAAGSGRPATPDEDPAEIAEFVSWLLDDNFVLLGLRTGQVPDTRGTTAPASGLGLLSDPARSPEDLRPDESDDDRPGRVPGDTTLFRATRTTALSTVHRRVPMEDLYITRPGLDGRPASRLRLIGLFTRKAYAEPAASTPLLRRKLANVLEREDVVPGSHDEVILVSLFQALPKDELLQTDVEQLHDTLVGLLHAEDHRDVRAIVRTDRLTHAVSVLVAVPRDRYSPRLREQLQELLLERYQASSIEAEVALGDRKEALVRFLLQFESAAPAVPVDELQEQIRQLSRFWSDEVAGLLRERFDASEAAVLERVAARFPRAYQETVPPSVAIDDVQLVSELLDGAAPLAVALHDDPSNAELVRLRAAQRGRRLELSTFLPILESVGLTVIEEIPYQLEGDGDVLQLHDFGVRAPALDPHRDGRRLADAVLAAARGHLEIDAMNGLVLAAELEYPDVAVLRAYRRLRRQFGTAFTPHYVDATLLQHARVAAALADYFHARFDPHERDRDTVSASTRQRLVDALDTVSRLDHHRILRGFLELIDATVRTNAFRIDAVADAGEPYLSFKLDPSRISQAPEPVPFREIFVHSPRVEGIHLRAGPVARGGLRWSDRRDDVRSEVLDLVKAQILKNAVIVPTGAKGGFVVKQEPDDPAELHEEVRRQYVTFVRGLLDVTDDLDGDRVVGPPGVVRYDGADPYLVVAADRGTATFSDTANELAARYGFWLDDAFASGGSSGYDHKALGVTARGAWRVVRRHFRELGVDVQTEPITMVGIGDMSGDVFGNGLLCSRAVKLVAAFDHRDIFLDPDPDPEVSFEERRRLFELRGSTWRSYDRSLISPGGGVFPRASRRVPLSEEVCRLLRDDRSEMSPPELIRALLGAPVDLIFAAGIGTYIKASSERDETIGDRANQEVRVDATEVRARVITEGANLAVTQRARIEYARRGGRINQDAIDNAAGVITSDREVNLKILLRLAEEAGELDRGGRDRLLAELMPEVVDGVMRDVDLQAAAITREAARGANRVDDHLVLLRRLEEVHGLDRAAELLPSDAELARRADRDAGLTRPEIATEIAWAKRDVHHALLSEDARRRSPLLESPSLAPAAEEMFPPTAVARFSPFLARHRLRSELIAAAVANDIVNRMGPGFAAVVAHVSGHTVGQAVLAYRTARSVIDAPRWWSRLEALSSTHAEDRLLELSAPLERLLQDLTLAILADSNPADLVERVPSMAKVADTLTSELLQLGTVDQRRARIAHARWLVDDLVDPDLARLLACAGDLKMLPDVTTVLDSIGHTWGPMTVADVFLKLGEAVGIDRLEARLSKLTPGSGWRRQQYYGLASDLRRARREAVTAALAGHPTSDEQQAMNGFLTAREERIVRTLRLVDAAQQASADQLEAVAVAVRGILESVQADPRGRRESP